MEQIIRTNCQACHCECGVFVHLEDGKVIKIQGDPDNPMNRGFTCVKGRAQPQLLYHPDRVLYPMRRAGERGSGKWERVSWDEALGEISEKLTALRDAYGPESFATMHGTGPRPTHYSTPLLAHALGSPNMISTDYHICWVPSAVAGRATLGMTNMIEKGPDYLNAECIMVVGGNPLASHPPRGMDILEALRKRKARLIVVDPYRTDLAERADLWMQIRPGTDAALALGMIRVIIDQGLYDRQFVHEWCLGFEELRERVQQYPLERVEEITWVPAPQIEAAARMYATTKPAVLHQRVAVEHNINSTQTCRALAIMIALTGNLDIQGGNIIPMSMPGYISFAELCGEGEGFRIEAAIAKRRIGATEHPLISGPEAPFPFVAAPLATDNLITGRPYPIRSIFCAGGNPILNQQNVRRFWTLLKEKIALLVVADFFMQPTAEIADYVLPAATWMERDDCCDCMYHNFVAARQKVIEPLGESWHDMKMSIEIAKRIPWADREFLPWDTVEEFNDALLRGAGMTFDELRRKSGVGIPMQYKKYEENGFHTPTGKVELYSTLFERHGYDPLPSYKEPPESPVSTPGLLEEYPYILFTGNRHVEFFHSEGRQIPDLRDRVPDPWMEIHPDTARKEDIQDGDWVWIETPQVKGQRVRFKARVTDRMHPKMVQARHGWWFPEKPGPEHGCFESNVNVVTTDDPPREEICASVRTRGTLCRIYK